MPGPGRGGDGGDQPRGGPQCLARDPRTAEIRRGGRPRVEGARLPRPGRDQYLRKMFSNFSLQVGSPPPTFFLFFQQYDWNIYSGETLTDKVIIKVWI